MAIKLKDSIWIKYQNQLEKTKLICDWCHKEKQADELYNLDNLRFIDAKQVCKDCLQSHTDEEDEL